MPNSIEKTDILVVDDKPDNLLALDVILEALGQNVVLARSGREALRHVLRREFAVILLDINMPTMDGFETAELIRQHRASRHTPIIFVTANSEDLYIERSYALGAVDYILTPVVPTMLRSKVSVFVDLFKKNREVRRQAESLERQTARLRLLTSASLKVNAALSLDSMIAAIAEAARDVLHVREARTTAMLGRPNERTRSATAVTPDAERAARALPGSLSAEMTATDGRIIGSIEVSGPLEQELSHEDETILAQLAQIASIAIQNCVNAEEREANRIKDEFLATLSHELRTPLGAILGWTRLLRAGHLDAQSSAHALAVIERNALAQTKLIDELLDHSRIATGTLAIHRRPIPLAPVIESVIDALRPSAEAKEVEITTSLGSHCVVSGDSDRLHQVVSNLLSNSIKFTPRGGHIDIALLRTDDYVEVRVTDDGDGIAPEFLDHVFDRFRQGDSTSRRSQGGLGLGLALVRHIAELHNGEVHAESAGKGRGARFVVRLPAEAAHGTESHVEDAPDEAPHAAPPDPPAPARAPAAAPRRANPGGPAVAPGRTLEGLSVVLVEDNADTREILGEILRRHSADVTAVASIDEAIEAIDARPPDVLVSDLALPGGDGYDLIRRLRQRAPREGGALPALALTAYARPEDRERALSAGFHMHAAKPIKPAELVAAVAALADGSAP